MTENTVEAEDGFYSPEDIAKYLRVSLEMVRKAYRAEELRVVRIGRLVRSRRSWVDAWAEGGSASERAA